MQDAVTQLKKTLVLVKLTKTYISVLLVVLFFNAITLKAGQPEDYKPQLKKIQANIDFGDYKLARRQLDDLIKNREKKEKSSTGPNAVSIEILAMQAEIAAGKAQYLEADLKIRDCLEASKVLFKVNSSQNAAYNLRFARLQNLYSYYLKAEKLAADGLAEAKAIKLSDSLLYNDLRFEIAYAKVQEGYIMEGKMMLNHILNFRKAAALNPTIFAPKLPDKTFKLANLTLDLTRSYARALILDARIEQIKGDNTQATKSVSLAIDYIEANLKRKDKTYIEALIVQGDIDNAADYYDDGLESYQDAYKLLDSKSTYAYTHRYGLKVLEEVARSCFRTDNFNGSRKYEDKLKTLAEEYFDSEPEYMAVYELIHAYEQEAIKNTNGAYNILNSIFSTDNKVLPFSPDVRARSIQYFRLLAIDLDSGRLIQKISASLLATMSKHWGTNAPITLKENLTGAYYNASFLGKWHHADSIYQHAWLKVVKPLMSKENRELPDYSVKYATILIKTDRIVAAESELETARIACYNASKEKSLAYAKVITALGSLYMETGRFDKALQLLDRAEKIIKKDLNLTNVPLLDVLDKEAQLHIILSDNLTATNYLAEAKVIRQTLSLPTTIYHHSPQEDEARIAFNTFNYKAANEDLIRLLNRIEDNITGTQQLITPLTLQAEIHLAQGQLAEAETNITQALNIAKGIFNDTSVAYYQCLAVQGRISKQQGDFFRSQQIADAVQIAYIKKLGPKSLDLAYADIDLALITYQITKNQAKTEELLKEAQVIISASVGTNHPAYGKTLQYLSLLKIDQQKLDSAYVYLESAMVIYKASFGKRNPNVGALLELAADINRQRGKLKEAESLYMQARGFYLTTFGKEHPQYFGVMSKLARVEFMQGDKNHAIKATETNTEIALQFIRSNFPSLSDREKANYWNLIRPDFEFFNTLATKYSTSNSALLGKMLNNSMATKALLLSSSVRVRNRILRSGDYNLIKLYKRYQDQRDLIATLGIDDDNKAKLALAVQEAENLEKQLSVQSEDFANVAERQTITWEDVKAKLPKNGYAVDIIRYRHFSNTFTDSVLYAALIFGKNSNQPTLVTLPNGNFLEGKAIKLYQSVMRNKLSDSRPYQYFWHDIKAKIPDGATIFIALDGVFNQFNIETLADSTGSYAIDKNSFVQVSNLKDLAPRQSNAKADKQDILLLKTAYIIGNPAYYKAKLSSAEETEYQDSGTLVENLPGTETETKAISAQLGANGYDATLLVGPRATEESLKSMVSPTIFHIATHGFFLKTTEANAEKISGLSASQGNNTDQVLLRSGLVLKDGGYVLSKGGNLNQSSGILTAFEAMNLNLEKTELVVLSACETGVGEVQVGEGVYGLQRSFQVAGAKNVIMSLFKVNDEATQQLMALFYQEYLKSGNKREAFTLAKRALKLKYPDPIYWGSFVMLGQ